MRDGELVVHGYREFLSACDHAGKDAKREVRDTLRGVGLVVRLEAQSLFERYDSHTAAGYRVVVRQRGVAVEQRLRKTTGKRPDFGALQMREALVPALEQKRGDVERRFEQAIDKVADHFENH